MHLNIEAPGVRGLSDNVTIGHLDAHASGHSSSGTLSHLDTGALMAMMAAGGRSRADTWTLSLTSRCLRR